MPDLEYPKNYATMSIDLPHAGLHKIDSFPHFFKEKPHPIKVQLVNAERDGDYFIITLGSIPLDSPNNESSLLSIDTYDPWQLGLTVTTDDGCINYNLRNVEFVEEGEAPYENEMMPYVKWRAQIRGECKGNLNGYIELQINSWRDGYKIIQPGVLVWFSEWED